MILTCPECGTQYVVKDGAIPPDGRQVRCAACKHSWHQDHEPDAAGTPDDGAQRDRVAAGREGARDEQESVAEATLIEPRSGPEAEERAYEEAVIEGNADEPATDHPTGDMSDAPLEDVRAPEAALRAEDWNDPPHAEATSDTFSPFAEGDGIEPRRRSPLATALLIALVIIVLAALFWFFAPLELKARLGLAAAGASPLALVMTHMDRQQLESGNQLLTVTGRVINPTTKEQDVPPLEARLTDRAGKLVYSWTIAPPAHSLPAGQSASFNSAEVNVPPGGEFLTITPGGPKAS